MEPAAQNLNLNRIPLFASLQGADLERLRKLAEIASFGEGEAIFSEGDPADGMYILAEGKVEVRKRSRGEEGQEVLATLGPYAIFGEMTVVHEGASRRSAAVHSISEVTVVKIGKDAFRRLVGENDPIAVAVLTEIVHILSDRLARLDAEMVRLLNVPEEEVRSQLADLSRFRDQIFSEWSF